MSRVTVITDQRMRFMARFMLLFAAVFSALPFLVESNPFKHFMFYLWYGFLALWTLLWSWIFIKNPRVFIHMQEGELVWGDELNRRQSGSANLSRMKELLVETTPGDDHNWVSYFVVLDDGSRLQISSSAVGSVTVLLDQMRRVNPAIQRRDVRK